MASTSSEVVLGASDVVRAAYLAYGLRYMLQVICGTAELPEHGAEAAPHEALKHGRLAYLGPHRALGAGAAAAAALALGAEALFRGGLIAAAHLRRVPQVTAQRACGRARRH